MSGKVFVVGIGPGSNDLLTLRAIKAIEKSEVIIGYKFYVELVKDLCHGKEVINSFMTKEIERCKQALQIAEKGKIVSLVSGGDAGIYGMAGLILELVAEEKKDIEIEIIPAVSANNAAAAILGAPIMHDHCSISLSDRLTPWELIEKRLHLAAQGDFVTSIYNPKSKGRPHFIEQARDIFLKHCSEDRIVGIVKNAERENQEVFVSTLKDFIQYEIDMFTVIIIGNSNTRRINDLMITPRGYKV